MTNRKGHHKPIVNWAVRKAIRGCCDGEITRTDEFEGLDRYREHNVEVVIERWTAKPPKNDLEKSVGKALDLGQGRCLMLSGGGEETWHSTSRVDPATGKTYPEIEPALLFLEFAQRMVPLLSWVRKDPRQAQGPFAGQRPMVEA